MSFGTATRRRRDGTGAQDRRGQRQLKALEEEGKIRTEAHMKSGEVVIVKSLAHLAELSQSRAVRFFVTPKLEARRYA